MQVVFRNEAKSVEMGNEAGIHTPKPRLMGLLELLHLDRTSRESR